MTIQNLKCNPRQHEQLNDIFDKYEGAPIEVLKQVIFEIFGVSPQYIDAEKRIVTF